MTVPLSIRAIFFIGGAMIIHASIIPVLTSISFSKLGSTRFSVAMPRGLMPIEIILMHAAQTVIDFDLHAMVTSEQDCRGQT